MDDTPHKSLVATCRWLRALVTAGGIERRRMRGGEREGKEGNECSQRCQRGGLCRCRPPVGGAGEGRFRGTWQQRRVEGNQQGGPMKAAGGIWEGRRRQRQRRSNAPPTHAATHPLLHVNLYRYAMCADPTRWLAGKNSLLPACRGVLLVNVQGCTSVANRLGFMHTSWTGMRHGVVVRILSCTYPNCAPGLASVRLPQDFGSLLRQLASARSACVATRETVHKRPTKTIDCCGWSLPGRNLKARALPR